MLTSVVLGGGCWRPGLPSGPFCLGGIVCTASEDPDEFDPGGVGQPAQFPDGGSRGRGLEGQAAELDRLGVGSIPDEGTETASALGYFAIDVPFGFGHGTALKVKQAR